jgi:DMSO/TMAO reductase YedYZ molybdopterin-dependent catalytic subunit
MLSRRTWMLGAVRLGAAAAAAGWVNERGLSAQNPPRGPIGAGLTARAAQPPDYETPTAFLDSFITPNERFFVRCHLPVPSVLDAASWTLKIDGSVNTPVSLSLADLRALPAVTVTMTLECAGNGRAFFTPPVAGIQWQKGAVGTARWRGVRLADVLAKAGVKPSARFIATTSADQPLGKMPAFVRQVPVAKALHADTILAFEMNGAPIPAEHGFPLRLIVPGWEGAYSVKWLKGLTALDSESDSFWVAGAYRYPVTPPTPGTTVDAKDMQPLTGLVVKSLITQPADGAPLAAGPLTVAGFAWAGEAAIGRVEVSVDGGATWADAQLVGESAPYTWRRFELRATLPAGGPQVILSRATDASGRTQPQAAQWNPNGYLWNQWDAVRVGTGATPMASHPAPPPVGTAGPGPYTLNHSCTSCHGLDLVEQQRLDRAGWERELDKMMRWGANMPYLERPPLVDFLAGRYKP